MEEGVGKTPVALPSIESKNTPLDVRLPTPKPDVAKKIEKVVPGQAENWNTRNLGLRVAADGASALSAGLLVAPVITMIDKAIIVRAATSTPLTHSLASSLRTLLLRPHTFLLSTPFFLVTSLYTGTYLTANLIDTLSSTLSSLAASTTTSGPAKFLATSAANLSLCLYKDSQFTRMFGAGSSTTTTTTSSSTPCSSAIPRAIPKTSYALFATRDMLTVFASFNLPPLLAPHLPLPSSWDSSDSSRANTAQFLAPAAMQLVSTPLHLLGLDLYNRPRGQYMHWTGRALVNYGPSAAERGAKVRRDWLGSSFARMGRIVPAFGVGGVVNKGVRGRLMAGLE